MKIYNQNIVYKLGMDRKMNMITCGEHCRHNRDGYCSLNHISSIKGAVGVKCGYFSFAEKPCAADNQSPATGFEPETVQRHSEP